QAVVQATHHCNNRMAFGKRLSEQPLMQNVLADLVIESEAALAFSMRIAGALDNSQNNEQDKLLVRLGTAVGKYWICKRAPGHAYEAMECIGGAGVMEDCIMPRLFRESPVNSIWEGSGNVQCLDMMRAIGKNPATLEAFMAEVAQAKGVNVQLDRAINSLGNCFKDQKTMEYRARSIVQEMALAIHASTLILHGDAKVAEAYCASRLSDDNQGWVYGTLPTGIDCAALIVPI
ncbi:MAG: DNA alkylation response protein, partial [Algicola sp.]|nr:DNA alkylation response protein [Algicola sp.]